jgi:hypothetical protein
VRRIVGFTGGNRSRPLYLRLIRWWVLVAEPKVHSWLMKVWYRHYE